MLMAAFEQFAQKIDEQICIIIYHIVTDIILDRIEWRKNIYGKMGYFIIFIIKKVLLTLKLKNPSF